MYEAMCCNFTRLEQGAKAYNDKSSANLSAEDKRLLEKYPIDITKLLQIKRVQENITNMNADKKVTLEGCIRANIKFAPEIYGKEWSDKITNEDLQKKQQKTQEKTVTNTKLPKTKQQQPTKPKPTLKKHPYNGKR
jgi:hypothetical protein